MSDQDEAIQQLAHAVILLADAVKTLESEVGAGNNVSSKASQARTLAQRAQRATK